jgi:ribosomal protein S18 acetylase RimI-like enzyme
MSLRTSGTAADGPAPRRRAKRGIVPRVTVQVEVLSEATDEAVEAFGRLLPQLSRSAPPLDKAALAQIIAAPASTLLIARSDDGAIAGTLTLVIFPIPTGLRAWIEDVVVDDAAGRQGIGSALTLEALRLAREAGARTVDLSSRPSRVAAGKLYEKLGFQTRETRMYRYPLA